MLPLILASSSPRRVVLLKQLGIPFEVVPPPKTEIEIKKGDFPTKRISPEEIVKFNALNKARAVATTIETGLIIGGDTLIVLSNGDILGKPQRPETALEMLQKLNGTNHRVISAVAIVNANTQEEQVQYTTTVVHFRKVTDTSLHNYVKTGEPLDKAGGYAIQEKGSFLVQKIHGSYSAVVGLPLEIVVHLLAGFGINISDYWLLKG